jgi:hypothetical protein
MSGSETFEQSDEAFDEADRLDPDFLEGVELDPSLDPAQSVDELELEEAGAELDDPEVLAVLPGGGDDPDGGDLADRAPSVDEAGWNLSEGDPLDQE